jgi:hypothetical protein
MCDMSGMCDMNGMSIMCPQPAASEPKQ